MNISKLLIVLCSILLACTPTTTSKSGKSGEKPSTSPTPRASTILSTWRASLSTSGGISGAGGGLEVWSDGSVFSREILVGARPAMPVYKGMLSKMQVEDLEKALTEAKSVALLDYSNMSTSLHWQADDSSFRHDWVWSMDDPSLASQLKRVESAFTGAKDLEPGKPPFLTLGDVKSNNSSAALLIGQGQSYKLNLFAQLQGTDHLDISLSGEAQIGGLSDLQDQSFHSEDKLTSIKIDKVSGGWVEGSLEQDGQKGSFRLPTWVTVAP